MVFILSLITTFIISSILYIIFLPPFNIFSVSFWFSLIIFLLLFTFTYIIYSFRFNKRGNNLNIVKYIIYFIFILTILLIINTLVFNQLFFTTSYANQIDVKDGNYYDDIKTDYNNLILIDKDISIKLSDKIDLLDDKYIISNDFNFINYNNSTYAIAPLEFSNVFKYMKYKDVGVKGYVLINTTTLESKVVSLDKGMKYTKQGILFNNILFRLRLKYPTKVFGDMSFEIDSNGNPYYVIPTLDYIGIGKLEDVEGCIIFNPITGTSSYHSINDIPSWVNHLYSEDLILKQINNHSIYSDGFLNSIFGDNILKLSDGYNYMTINDDIYIYSGILNSNTKSNIGYILSNLRTKETTLYRISSPTIDKAIKSTLSLVKKYKYNVLYPILANIDNRATYIMPIIDNNSIIKKYALMDLRRYENIKLFDASLGIEDEIDKYLNSISFIDNEAFEKKITVNYIETANIDGNTYYYIIDNNGQKYMCSININDKLLPFIKVGDKVIVTYLEELDVIDIIDIN